MNKLAIIDPGFGVDDFNNPKVLSEAETIKNNILTLLFMKKGSYPSIPELGIGIQNTLYQFFDDIDTEELTNRIAAQCAEFIPSVNSGSLKVKKTYQKTQAGNLPVLLIVVPTSVSNTDRSLVVALTTTANGDIAVNTDYVTTA